MLDSFSFWRKPCLKSSCCGWLDALRTCLTDQQDWVHPSSAAGFGTVAWAEKLRPPSGERSGIPKSGERCNCSGSASGPHPVILFFHYYFFYRNFLFWEISLTLWKRTLTFLIALYRPLRDSSYLYVQHVFSHFLQLLDHFLTFWIYNGGVNIEVEK